MNAGEHENAAEGARPHRDSSTGGLHGRGRARSNGESPPRRVVRPAGAAGNGAGDEFGGGRSSGELGTEAAGHGEARGKVR